MKDIMRRKTSLLVLFLLFVLPFTFLFYLLISEINGTSNFAQKERLGVRYNEPLRRLLEDLIEYRASVDTSTTSSILPRNALRTKRAMIAGDIQSVDAIDDELGATLEANEEWTKLKAKWQSAGSGNPSESEAISHVITSMITDTLSLIAHVGDTSNLILDPDLDSYYFMDAVVTTLPRLADDVAQAKALGEAVVERRRITEGEKRQLIVIAGLIKSAMNSVGRGMQVAYHYNPNVTSELQSYKKSAAAIDEFLTLINRKLITGQTINIRPTEYSATARSATNAPFALYDDLSSGLDRLLQARIERSIRKRYFVTIFALIVMAVTGYVFVAFSRSMAAQLNAEESVRESEARMRVIFDTQLDAVIVMDEAARITDWNPHAEAIFGWTREEAVGRRLSETVIPDQYREAHEKGLKHFLATGEGPVLDKRIEITALHRNGHEFPVELAIAPAKLGNKYTFSGFLRDITERKQAEEALQQAKEEAEAADRAKSQFLANMSHELRTPLNAIIGYSEMLREEAEDLGVTELAPDLEKIQSAGTHLLALINDILDLSKIDAGKMDLYLETFNLGNVIQEVKATIQPLVEKKANTLTVQVPDDIGEMHADLTKVRQALFNLLSNACKFTDHGTIALDVSRQNAEGKDWIVLRVTDTGIGMTDEQMGKLFQIFTQADASTTRKYGGTGLGLTITKRFCEMMGGEVMVESELHKGSVFTIKLPADVAEPKRNVESSAEEVQEPQPESTPLVAGTNTILVIDDDPTMHDLIRRFLSHEEFQVVTCSSGKEGIRLAKELKPSVITLDVLMPGMDGWAVLTELKADPELEEIPVVMITMVEDKSIGYALGVSDYLTKPVERDRLVAVLKKYQRESQTALCPVLVVEDDGPTRQMMKRILTKEGCTVVEAENGRIALERVAENPPALILLDLMMPEMDGFQFVAELRKTPEWRSIPVVVVTAKDITAADRQRLNGHVQQIVQKGAYNREELLREVRDLVTVCIRQKSEQERQQ